MAINSQPTQIYTLGIDAAFKRDKYKIYIEIYRYRYPNSPQEAILSLPENLITKN